MEPEHHLSWVERLVQLVLKAAGRRRGKKEEKEG
jgi:hypothetical protein